MNVEVKILDHRLHEWGFPVWGSKWAVGLDLHACLPEPLHVHPQAPAVLVSTGIAFRIGDPEWSALVLPRSGLGHLKGLVLGNLVGIVDPDFEGPCMISLWNRNRVDTQALVVNPGDRIAQLVFTRVTRPTITIVEEFSERSPRGSAGYGSTGV